MMLLLVAWIAPPSNVDSLLYHISRIVHWAQNGSLEHYATGYHHQLFMPPWAELANLHLRILWGSDRPADLVQWFRRVGSVAIASGVGELLGLRRKGQLITAVFIAGIPMGILQATSTQNDYVVTFEFSKRLAQSAGHVQSVIVGSALGIVAFLMFLRGLLSDLIARNRWLAEEILYRLRLDQVGARRSELFDEEPRVKCKLLRAFGPEILTSSP